MPDNQHPPFEHNAQVHPRRLNRWLDKNAQGGKLRRCETYITLPAFTKADEWNGYSDIVVAFNFEASNNFSLKVPIMAPASPNYALFISWHEDGVMRRYLLWDATGSNFNFTTVPYTGQLIKKNFRFEVWNTSQGAVSNADDILFYTSKLQPIDYRYAQDVALADNGGEVNDFDTTLPQITTVYSPIYTGGVTSGMFSVPIENFVIGKTYIVTNISPNCFLGTAAYTGDVGVTFVATQTTYYFYGVLVLNTALEISIQLPITYTVLGVCTFNQYALPIVFPVNSTSTTN